MVNIGSVINLWLKEVGKLFKSLFDLAVPAYCISCNEVVNYPEIVICSNCYLMIPKIDNQHIMSFLERIPEQHFDNVIILFEYSETIQKLMHLYKYQEYLKLANLFSKSISDKINKHYDIITYVPLHESKERERGFNQSKIIAQIVANNTNLVFGESFISRTKFTTTQTKLTRNQRIQNINKAFIVGKDVSNLSILIIDDVITTGATLNECSRVLKDAGSGIVDIIALATPTNILE